MPTAANTTEDVSTDGRHARRMRGRNAVTEAMLGLVLEGALPPTPQQVAERAGVSTASLYRYFDTLDDLRTATTHLYHERFSEMFDVPRIGRGDRHERIATFVGARVSLYEAVEPVERLARWRAVEVPELRRVVDRGRARFADQIRRHFDPELGALAPARRDDLVTVVASLTSFESWDQARHAHGRTPEQTRRAWRDALDRIVAT